MTSSSSMRPIKMLLHFLFLTTAAAEMSPKIVGGGEADIEDWPFIVFIAIIGTEAAATCGGSLISAQTVLTAAHCLDDVTDNKQNFNEFKYTILMGHQKFQHSKMVRSVSDYETHHNYDPSATACDIGIMFLSKPVQFSTTVKKVLLMKKLSYKKDKLMQVAGWGAWKVDFPSNSLTLKSLAQTLLPAKKCDKFTDMGDLPAEGWRFRRSFSESWLPSSNGYSVLQGRKLRYNSVYKCATLLQVDRRYTETSLYGTLCGKGQEA
ncbi:hypothetical protein MSG28_001280 [Choristoneura fumiferana]|uniref:Uncharacterized protein n=1 Tax=Choristoneura fumiferana TaxID=7141 RepID=A0ACC0K4H9_CHOFU|nr:hypothetical protein MSG28_001280 [Choristoneura fumiferana]